MMHVHEDTVMKLMKIHNDLGGEIHGSVRSRRHAWFEDQQFDVVRR
jgi:hypothetical protein